MYIDSGYLFEGHLTVDPEPSQPQWLLQQSNLMNTVASLMGAESSRGSVENNNTSETAANLFQELINNLDVVIPEVFISCYSMIRWMEDMVLLTVFVKSMPSFCNAELLKEIIM